MPVIPNLRRSSPRPGSYAGDAPVTPTTFVDTPTMDYQKWLAESGESIATFDNPSRHRVAIIGSGGAGLAAAYELLRCGLDVTVYEATDRVGGRLFTIPSSTGDGNLFEMGAMRFTPSEHVLHWYGDLFNKTRPGSVVFDTGPFPDPGENLTYIAFQGQTYIWDPRHKDAHPLPAQFARVNDGWNAFMKKGFTSADGSITLEAPATITCLLQKPEENTEAIVHAWSSYIRAFVNSTLYEAVVRIFTDENAPGPDMGKPAAERRWNQADLEFFGALGTGFGGFGPLFPICFLDIMRFVINAVDSDQHELLTGVESLVRGFCQQPIPRPDGETCVEKHIVRNRPVTGVSSDGTSVTLTFANAKPETFDRVIVATSHRSMELTMGMGASENGTPLAEHVADAVRRVHLENSSKVFVETRAFWDEDEGPGHQPRWPRNVVGDTILRNFYTLTYPDAPKETGALLFSYTWADDSVKQQTFTQVDERIALLLRDLKTISPELAAKVDASIRPGTARLIDWQNNPYYYGAFKLNQPGQDAYVASMFYDFQKASLPEDTGVYIAGDSVGFLGGWVENAFQTGLNAAAAVALSLGGRLTAPDLSPFQQLKSGLYDYSPTPGVPSTRGETGPAPLAAGGRLHVPG